MSYCYRILHIADPHFSQCHFRGTPSVVGRLHAEELRDVLLQNKLLDKPLDAIILSGDFTFACRTEGFEAAEVFIETLVAMRTAEGYPVVVPEQNILVIPGNHDINLGEPVVMGTRPGRQISLPTPKSEAEKEFRAFLARIGKYVGSVNDFLSMIVSVERKGEGRLVIFGLNSSRVERGDARGWGYIGIDQIYDVAAKLNNPAWSRIEKGDILLAVTHHNLLPIWDLGLETLNSVPGQRTFSFTMDTGSTLNFLADLGVGAMLHGHTHVQSAKAVEGYGSNADLANLPTLILGAGTLGMRTQVGDENPPPHHFQLILIETNASRVPQLSYRDLSALSHEFNKPRKWEHTESRHIHRIYPSWNPDKVRATLRARRLRVEHYRSTRDAENTESWSVLRAKVLDHANWPQALEELYQRILLVDGSATKSEVANAVEQLFVTPPAERDICAWGLEEYLQRNLKDLSAQFLAARKGKKTRKKRP